LEHIDCVETSAAMQQSTKLLPATHSFHNYNKIVI